MSRRMFLGGREEEEEEKKSRSTGGSVEEKALSQMIEVVKAPHMSIN